MGLFPDPGHQLVGRCLHVWVTGHDERAQPRQGMHLGYGLGGLRLRAS